MALDRRQILKLLAASPLSAFSSSLYGWLPPKNTTPAGYAHVLLHGLFFMEYQKDCFAVASPKHDPHCFFYFDHNTPASATNPTAIPPKQVWDLTTGDLVPGPAPVVGADPFPPEILHFSKADLNHSGNFIDLSNPSNYACAIKLPFPKYIIALRCGSFADFHPDMTTSTTNVANSIYKHCGGRVALIAWLYYETATPTPSFQVRSLHAEHGRLPSLNDVNCALRDAQTAFSDFDLRIADLNAKFVPMDPQWNLPDQIASADEESYIEMASNPCSHTPCPPPEQAGAQHSVRSGQRGPLAETVATSIQPSNCPLFGVGP